MKTTNFFILIVVYSQQFNNPFHYIVHMQLYIYVCILQILKTKKKFIYINKMHKGVFKQQTSAPHLFL